MLCFVQLPNLDLWTSACATRVNINFIMIDLIRSNRIKENFASYSLFFEIKSGVRLLFCQPCPTFNIYMRQFQEATENNITLLNKPVAAQKFEAINLLEILFILKSRSVGLL